MATTPSTRRALQFGRKQAQEVLKFRNRALRKRAAALKAKPTRMRSLRAVEIEPKLLRAVDEPQTAAALWVDGGFCPGHGSSRVSVKRATQSWPSASN